MRSRKINEKTRPFKPRSHDFKTVKIRTESSGFALKTLIITLIILGQLAFFIYLHVRFAMAFKWWSVACFVMSVVTCVYVLSSNKNGLSKAVWIMFLLLCFEFSVPIYFLSDERLFFRKAKKRYAEVFDRTDCFIQANQPSTEQGNIAGECKYLYTAGKFTAYNNTEVKYFPSGYLFYESLIEQIKTAKEFIFLEYYIVSDGVLFKRIYEQLCKKVSQGVSVRLIYDDMGSHRGLKRKVKKMLKSAGIKFMPFNKLVPVFAVGLNYRDHRKITVIDGKVAFTGGCNLADEYINEKRMHGYWKDSGVRLEGPAVDGFTLAFLRQWEYLTGVKEDYLPFLNKAELKKNTSCVVPYVDGPEYKLPIGKNVYENLIAGANEKLYIMTPYFIPDDSFAFLMANKALSGVDVRIIIPDIPDKNYVYSVSRNNAEKLIECGVKVYIMKNAFVHAKTVMSEKAVSTGSINVDLRSFYQQFESAIVTDDKKVILDVEKDFNQTFKKCILLDKNNLKRKNLFNRIKSGVMQIIAPFM